MLFVLLQCLSPLAHAHVDGHDAGHSLWNVHAQSPESDVESHEGAVVAMPHAYPASDHRLIAEPISGVWDTMPLSALADANRCYVVANTQTEPSNLFYVLAWSQAPPRIILTA